MTTSLTLMKKASGTSLLAPRGKKLSPCDSFVKSPMSFARMLSFRDLLAVNFVFAHMNKSTPIFQITYQVSMGMFSLR